MKNKNLFFLATSVAPTSNYCLTVVFVTYSLYTHCDPDINRGKFNYYHSPKICHHLQLRPSTYTKFRPGTLMLIYRVLYIKRTRSYDITVQITITTYARFSTVTNILIHVHDGKRKICFLLHCGNKRKVMHEIITEGYCDVTHPFVVASNKLINISTKHNLNFETKQDKQCT